MRRTALALLASASLVVSGLVATSAGAAPPSGNDLRNRLDVWTGEVTTGQLSEIVDLGVDRHELEVSALPGESGTKGHVRVEAVMTGRQAEMLRGQGLDLEPKKIDGQTVAERATALAASGYEVFRTYLGAGGLQEELQQVAADNPRIAKLVTIGESVNGTPIQAVKVTLNAPTLKDGQRPATLYMAAQHAREWITPEMVRRLLHHVLDGYGTDPEITQLVNTTELWFLPVANPDGYDFTFQPGQRLWRKNLRDNNGDGVITGGDGVDLNRNFPAKWGYDNEGSSPSPGSETYRGPAPASEPETQALDSFVGRVGFEFLVNYHSAAELLLYGVGWQVSTPTPDDVIHEAMAGDDANPAIPGYDPDISAELYTTNGETNSHTKAAHGTLGFTPEMATCESASNVSPDDEWLAEDCGSGFEFPDDEDLVQAEFEKNIPFAMAVGKSAPDPDDPVSVVGRTAEDFRVDTFDVSYGDPQTVAVWAKRALLNVRLNYRVDGGPLQATRVAEWTDGERYGDENNEYYAELRGEVRGASPGDRVEVWFTGVKPGTGPVSSERFTYELVADDAAQVLVIANEDYTGVNPDYPADVTEPKYDELHVAALEAAGYPADVWDVDAQGPPHDLGVLSHYDALVWYSGDDRFAMDPEDLLTSTPLGNLPDLSVKESQQYLTMAVRDFLNEGGKLVQAAEMAQHTGLFGISDAVGGLYYGLDGDPTAECVIEPQVNSLTAGFFEDCLILADDFRQYWLGAYTHSETRNPPSVVGSEGLLEGFSADFGGPVVAGANPLNEAGTYVPTSDVLPVHEFPQFASRGAAEYVDPNAENLFQPVEGEWYVGVTHNDATYTRLTRTVDLTGVTATQTPQLAFQLSADTEPGYDNVIVEAHTVGQENWTTLPELGGATTTDAPPECVAGGFLLSMHPWLTHYLGGADCTAPGTTGTWNAITGSTGGWQQVAFDLSAYAGAQVEVSVAYVTDPSSGGVGAFVDDTRLLVDGAATSAEGFESGLGVWSVTGPPPGSPPVSTEWERSQNLVIVYAGTSTEDTLLLGFGLEHLSTDAQRVDLVTRALGGLLP